MQLFPGSKDAPRRYLTLLYCFTLGLGLVLAFFAIDPVRQVPPAPATPTLASVAQAATSTAESTLIPIAGTPTTLPAIPPTPNETTPSALGVASGELRGVQVSLWHPWTGDQDQALEAILEEFNRTNRWGISVKATGYEGFGRLDEAVEQALAQDALPDVVIDYGYQARKWDASESLVDLNPYVNDPVWGYSAEEQKDFYPAFWQEDLSSATPAEARRLALPYYRSAYVLFYNQDWARVLGFSDPPVTPDDFRLQACTAAVTVGEGSDQTAQGKGGWLVTTQPGTLLGWIYSFGGEVIDAQDGGYRFNTPEALQALNFMKDLQDSGCAWLDAEADPQVEFANRQALFIVGSLFDISTQQNAMQNGSRDDWMVLPFPSKRQPAVDAYGPSIMIMHSSPQKQLAAWLVSQWLVYPPNQAGWVNALQAYPTRMSSLTYLGEAGSSPQWAQSLSLLPVAYSEPSLATWSTMRWAVQDALTALFDPELKAEQVPGVLENLDSLGVEISTQEQ